jgi:hypothetical protein
MFIVSLPYAVFHGGYWAILAMVGIAYIACYTGKILVDCLYETNEFGETVKVSAKSKSRKHFLITLITIRLKFTFRVRYLL